VNGGKISPELAFRARLMTTTAVRGEFGNTMRLAVHGDKAIVVLHRYKRAHGALLPIEAVRLLWQMLECPEAVDPLKKLEYQAVARAALAEQERLGIRG
jgi:hypothetical protein